MIFIATFYSHFGAISFKKRCDAAGYAARLMPVPRDLSSSCGTCVRYDGSSMVPGSDIPEDLEQIVQVTEVGYHPLYRAENS